MKKTRLYDGGMLLLLKEKCFIPLMLSILMLQVGCSDDEVGDAPPIFACEENIEKEKLSAAERALEDQLWGQTLKYLQGFLEALESTTVGCTAATSAITQTYEPKIDGVERECLSDKKDVQAMVRHIRAVLKYPDRARACFDAQRNYDEFPLYAPSDKMKAQHEVANWVGHPTLSSFYEKRPGAIGAAGRELANSFGSILSKSKTPAIISQDITYNTLPTLWASVGWLPFYVDNALALNDRFRGGYAYAEVMGPWGLLRIKAIDGESVGAEVGMTIQLGDTYYPYHYHDPHEIYINLTPPGCVGENKFMVMDWDNTALKQTPKPGGGVDVEVRAPKEGWGKWFATHSPSQDWITYFHRHAIHSFYVNKDCFDPNDPSGLVTMWARTTARQHDQTTRICAPSASASRPVGPGDLFTCAIDGIITD